MKNTTKFLTLVLISIMLGACAGETGSTSKKGKNSTPSSTSLVKDAMAVTKRMDGLKKMKPVANEDLAAWLPENIDGMERKRFKVGGSGVANVSAVDGTFEQKGTKKSFQTRVLDGAGENGSTVAMSFVMQGKMEKEIEDEDQHKQSVEVNGITANQTYYKKSNRTNLSFFFEERFVITIYASNMNPDETWRLVEKLNLEKLSDLTE